MGVKLGDETRGYTRFRRIAQILATEGFEVDLITSSFQHWNKEQRVTSKACYQGLPYRVVFIEEPGYKKNIDLARIRSHAKASKNLRTLLESNAERYDLIYAEIPPNDVARVCAEFAAERNIPFIADINDLWPEAMHMVIKNRLVARVLLWPFARDARVVYKLLTGAVGTSNEYAAHPSTHREQPYPSETVYVGNDLAEFDAGVTAFKGKINKPTSEFWVAYAGTLGESYDLATLVKAGALLANDPVCRERQQRIRIKILGDGPDRTMLESLATSLDAPVDFLGYKDYLYMAAYLNASDILINSLKKTAVQSIVTKIGDYLASGRPLINTGSSREFCEKVSMQGFGVNIEAEDPAALAEAIQELYSHDRIRMIMGEKARAIAEREFDQKQSYGKIVKLIDSLLENKKGTPCKTSDR